MSSPRAWRGPDHTLDPNDDGPLGFDPDDLSARDRWTQVGDGSFGKVYRAELLGEPVAVKVTANARPDRIAGLKRDLWYLNAFAHPNVTRVFGAFIEGGDCHMVMEFVPHSLRSKRVVNETNRVKVLADVARALTRVHAAGHVHRDVKARNVLISEVRTDNEGGFLSGRATRAGEGKYLARDDRLLNDRLITRAQDYQTAKLTDFGLARVLPGAGGVASREDVNPRLTPKIGPPKYRAPEVESGAPYDCSSDMYGYGVMCFQLIEQLKKRTRKTNEREVEFIRELGRLATQANPEKRPTARQCLTMCVNWLRGGETITPDVYPGRETYREKYWVVKPMDGGTWKHEGQAAHSPSASPSEDEEPASPRSDGDAGARVDAVLHDGSVEAQRGTKRDEREDSDTPVSAPPMNAAKRVNSTSTDLHVRAELEAVRLQNGAGAGA